MNFGRDAGELYFAGGIGASLEVEVMEAAKAVCNVDFHGCVVNRFASRVDGEFKGAGTHAAVNDRKL